jgi:hypothetical protein
VSRGDRSQQDAFIADGDLTPRRDRAPDRRERTYTSRAADRDRELAARARAAARFTASERETGEPQSSWDLAPDSAWDRAAARSRHHVVTAAPDTAQEMPPAPAPALAPEPVDEALPPAPELDWSPASGRSSERRTVTIRGRGSERYVTPSSRRRPERVYERTGFRPDRAAMWAVLLGMTMILVAATSAHAATLHAVAHLH